jgi:hypothetical protein
MDIETAAERNASRRAGGVAVRQGCIARQMRSGTYGKARAAAVNPGCEDISAPRIDNPFLLR